MSTWTSSARRAALLALTLPLAACLAPAQGGGQGGWQGGRLNLLEATDGKPSDLLRRVGLYRGEVIVAGPAGYCVDPKSVRRQVNSSFVLLASCAHLGKTETSDVPAAVITVSVLPRDARARQPSAAEMAAALNKSGVLAQIDGDGLSLVQVARGGDRVVPGGDPRHWRATMVINGHLVGLAAYSGPDGPATGIAGRDIVVAVAEAMLEASPLKRPENAPPADAAPQDAPSAGTPPEPQKIDTGRAQPNRKFRSIFTGLFRKPG